MLTPTEFTLYPNELFTAMGRNERRIRARAKPYTDNPRGPRKTKAEKKRSRKLVKAARRKQRGRK
jgi:hypothetical protein